jgi:hypothetical protein
MPQVRAAEFDAVSKADEVFVIGYSFPETDRDQWNLIHEARKKSATGISTLTIINHMAPQALRAYIENIKGLFQPRTIRVCNDGFANCSARANLFESALGT